MIADHAAGDAGFDQPLIRQVGVTPAGEKVQPIPLALSVAHKNEDVIGHRVGHVGEVSPGAREGVIIQIPSTSVMA